jgi:hypothetical protein
MQGTDGHGKGLTTYPASEDQEQLDAHADCLELEAQGTIRRHLEHDGVEHSSGLPFVIWMPVEGAPPPPEGGARRRGPERAPEPEPEAQP